MTDSTATWARLCALIDDDPDLAPLVLDADEDDRWEALFDGLDDAGSLAYLEQDDTGMELADALPALPRIFGTGVELDAVGDIDDLNAAIARADEFLAPHGLRLLYLDEDAGDDEDDQAFPLIAVPLGSADEIIALASSVGRTARAFG